jgi:hypothetical protein
MFFFWSTFGFPPSLDEQRIPEAMIHMGDVSLSEQISQFSPFYIITMAFINKEAKNKWAIQVSPKAIGYKML